MELEQIIKRDYDSAAFEFFSSKAIVDELEEAGLNPTSHSLEELILEIRQRNAKAIDAAQELMRFNKDYYFWTVKYQGFINSLLFTVAQDSAAYFITVQTPEGQEVLKVAIEWGITNNMKSIQHLTSSFLLPVLLDSNFIRHFMSISDISESFVGREQLLKTIYSMSEGCLNAQLNIIRDNDSDYFSKLYAWLQVEGVREYGN